MKIFPHCHINYEIDFIFKQYWSIFHSTHYCIKTRNIDIISLISNIISLSYHISIIQFTFKYMFWKILHNVYLFCNKREVFCFFISIFLQQMMYSVHYGYINSFWENRYLYRWSPFWLKLPVDSPWAAIRGKTNQNHSSLNQNRKYPLVRHVLEIVSKKCFSFV